MTLPWNRLQLAMASALLGISILCLGLDLFHLLFHLAGAPELWKMDGVPSKLWIKALSFFVPLLFLLTRRFWAPCFLAGIFFFGGVLPMDSWAASSRACQHARELLDKAGVSRDAKENFFGQVRRSPPHGSFPPDIDRVTWWGEFQPFEFWQSPEFQAAWINPQGHEVARQKFRGQKCRLAKTTLKTESMPRGMLEGGMWNVVVTCDDFLIDKQTFAVVPAGGPRQEGADTVQTGQDSAMIWAEDAVKD